MSARRRADARWSVQPSMSCDGMASALHANLEIGDESTLCDVFALWADRIADAHLAVAALTD